MKLPLLFLRYSGYNSLNLTAEARDESDNSLLAKYRWTADGAKAGVKDANGTTGFEYVGSLIYSRNGNALELESTGFGGGRFQVTDTGNGQNCTPNYFLTDHLGSTRAVFNSEGIGQERNDYYAFGGRWDVGLESTSANRFRFSGKEDQTTGDLPFQDFGARFLNKRLPVWTSIDPLAEKKHSISPYAYCSNNPVRLIDPDGMDEYEFTAAGFIKNVKSSDTDSFHKVTIDSDGNSTRVEGGSLVLDQKVVSGQISLNTNAGTEAKFLKITGDDAAKQIFEHLSNNSTEYETEYGLTRVGDKSGEEGSNMLGVNAKHEPNSTAANIAVFDNGYTVREATHNHPNGDRRSSDGDVDAAKVIQGKFPDAKLSNYTEKYGYTHYNRNTTPTRPTVDLDPITVTAKRTKK